MVQGLLLTVHSAGQTSTTQDLGPELTKTKQGWEHSSKEDLAPSGSCEGFPVMACKQPMIYTA